MTGNTAKRWSITLATLGLVAASCGSGSSTDDSAAATTTSAAPSSTTTFAVSETTAAVPEVELATVLDELLAETELPALGVTVFDGDGIIETAITGVRRAGDSTPVELTDRFSIGSNVKAMTATLVATYVDEGVISWETTVGDVYGDALPDLDDDLAQLTVRQLLSHIGGISDEAAYPAVAPLIGDFVDMMPTLPRNVPSYEGQRRELARVTLARQPDHPAGRFMYSNFGYTIVGDMLEELTGTSWEDLIRARLFDPLGMDSCGFYAPGTPGEVDQPWGHLDLVGGRAIDPGHPDAEMPQAIAPAGLVHCSMADWAAFLQFQLRGFQGSDTELISTDTFVALQTAPEGSMYALGWGLIPDSDVGTILSHDGSNGRFYSSAFLVPDEDVGFLVVTNLGVQMANPYIGTVVGTVMDRIDRG